MIYTFGEIRMAIAIVVVEVAVEVAVVEVAVEEVVVEGGLTFNE